MSEDEWAELLTGMQYQVTRGHGTERAWTGLHNDTKDKGCVFIIIFVLTMMAMYSWLK